MIHSAKPNANFAELESQNGVACSKPFLPIAQGANTVMHHMHKQALTQINFVAITAHFCRNAFCKIQTLEMPDFYINNKYYHRLYCYRHMSLIIFL